MIYLDNAASTPPAPEVLETLRQVAEEHFANPSSAHGLGAAAARRLQVAREEIAALLRGQPNEILFTSGGTEADAIGLAGAALAARGRHVVVTAIEHSAVLRTAEQLATRGFELSVVLPEKNGVVTTDAVMAAVRPDTAVVGVMLVNNEIGTIQPVTEIARALRAAGKAPHLHVDAVQAVGFVPLDMRTLGADSVAISGHKFHGPKGAGALWVRTGAKIAPLWDGGRQERGLRSGTENLPGWCALGKAAVLCRAEGDAPTRIAQLRDRLEALIATHVPEARPTVANAPRAPHVASVVLPALPAEPVLHALEAHGVYASAGSACASRNRGPSHVLLAIGIDESAAVIRFSLSRDTTDDAIEPAALALRDAVAEVRAVSSMTMSRSR